MSKSNGMCGVGVAYGAKLAGIRLLSSSGQYDSTEASALGLHSQHIHVYSNSWGPADDGMTVEGPGPLTLAVIKQGVTHVSLLCLNYAASLVILVVHSYNIVFSLIKIRIFVMSNHLSGLKQPLKIHYMLILQNHLNFSNKK